MSYKDYYNSEFKKKLLKEFNVSNPMSLPKITKIVVNVGVGEAITNKKAIPNVIEQIALIAGQKPVITKARKSVSAFKVRKGYPIGVKVTLRGKRMFDFLEKLVKIVIPRLRDFRGVSLSSIDDHGNINLGFTEQTIFPEVDFDKIDKLRGVQVTIVTTAQSKKAGLDFFKLLGIPFKN